MKIHFITALAITAALQSPGLAFPNAKQNRLAKGSSPYLRQHAHNPVDWYPWGEEAFQKARKENKLVFLSIGYSACHWCHVMEKESFSDEKIASYMNKHFVCIKVDREERPDIDHAYLTSLNVLGQRGGWPLSMFLTPDGNPFFGGTYWPPYDKEIQGQKMRGFQTILEAIQDLYQKEPDTIKAQSTKLADSAKRALAGELFLFNNIELGQNLVNSIVESVLDEFDPQHGGFGSSQRGFSGPKFPTPSYLLFLQADKNSPLKEKAAQAVELTLNRICLGGIFDHLAGGFHRYTVERTWTVPHFEKMLYDNAQLLEALSVQFAQKPAPHIQSALNRTVDFVLREMTAPNGGFYSSLDADSEGVEGKYYVWEPAELKGILGPGRDSEIFLAAFDTEPNFEEKHLILNRSKNPAEVAKQLAISQTDLEASIAKSCVKLEKVRTQRPRPFLDTKILTCWNGQMIAGLASAHRVTGNPKALEAATKSANFLLTNCKNSQGRLLRSFGAAPGETPKAGILAFQEDYAFLIHGLLTLHEVTQKDTWLTEAIRLNKEMIQHHGRDGKGPFYQSSPDHEKLFARSIDQYDGAQPSGNSIAILNMVRLYHFTKNEEHLKLAGECLQALAPRFKTSPTGSTALARSLQEYLKVSKSK